MKFWLSLLAITLIAFPSFAANRDAAEVTHQQELAQIQPVMGYIQYTKTDDGVTAALVLVAVPSAHLNDMAFADLEAAERLVVIPLDTNVARAIEPLLQIEGNLDLIFEAIEEHDPPNGNGGTPPPPPSPPAGG